MGRFILLIAAAMTLAAGITLSRGALQSRTESTLDVGAHSDRMTARSIALSGHEAIRQQVSADYEADGEYDGAASFSGAYQNGTYTSTVSISDEGRRVAISTTSQFNEAQSIVKATYVAGRIYRTPEFLAGGVATGSSLRVWHPLTVQSVAPGMNASVYVNGDMEFKVQATTSSIDGFGYYGGSFTNSSLTPTSDLFDPTSNPEGEPVVQKAEPVDIPVIDIEDYRASATRVFTGNTTLSSNITLGTIDAPEIWLFEGNLNTSGPITITGHGALVVGGSVKFMDDFTTEGDLFGTLTGGLGSADLSSIDSDIASAVLIMAEGKVDLKNADTVDANIIANGEVELKHGADLNGSITTRSAIDTKGPNTINYLPLAESISAALWTGEDMVEHQTTLGSLSAVSFWEGNHRK